MDAIARGPIHNLFGTLVNGLTSIRAYDQAGFFINQFNKESDRSANVTFTYSIANRWLGWRFDLAILILTLACACTSVFMRGMLETTLLIFSLQVIADVTNMFSIAMRFFAEMQNHMTSAQRIFAYTKEPQEDHHYKPNDPKRGEWPSKGQINFTNVTMRYRDFLEPAIENLNFSV